MRMMEKKNKNKQKWKGNKNKNNNHKYHLTSYRNKFHNTDSCPIYAPLIIYFPLVWWTHTILTWKTPNC